VYVVYKKNPKQNKKQKKQKNKKQKNKKRHTGVFSLSTRGKIEALFSWYIKAPPPTRPY